MTIKEIAELANVSVSTVSKVINKKDDSISAETRERILDIVKKYRYSPYMNRASEDSRPSLILGVLIGESADYGMLTGIVRRARARGYSTIVCTSSTAEEERQNFHILSSHHVDGIIWNKEPYSESELPGDLLQAQLPLCALNSGELPSAANPCFSFAEAGYAAAKFLVDKGHKNIGCLSSEDDFPVKDFMEGIRRCLFDHQLPADDSQLWCRRSACDAMWLEARTGVICFDGASLNKFLGLAERMNLRVPENISLVGVNTPGIKHAGVQISSIMLPYEELGEFAADRLIDTIETAATAASAFRKDYSLTSQDSIAPPRQTSPGHFVVVGTLNVDTLMMVERRPEPGETVNIKNRMIMPGGKGLNQALGISKLGASAALISSMGNDFDGRQVFDCLKSNAICTDGIITQEDIPTGHAYVFIQKNAESNISVFDGANDALRAEDIDRYAYLFENADYCLLQTELSQSLMLHTAKLAHHHGAKVILKPCAVTELLPELVAQTDILVPNFKEASTILPHIPSIEEKAKAFQEMGAKAVIITLAEKGCYLDDGVRGQYFPAAHITPVDTTGAADAFISALAFYLTLGKSMEEAVRYATCAGGLCTTRHGVPPALVDRETLEFYYFEHKDYFGRV